jgi:hypothetical protein
MKLKHAFISLTIIVLLMAAGAANATPPTSLGNLTGTWYNMQPTSGGVARIDVTVSSGQLQVRTYGKCTPNLCDWGTVNGSAFSRSVGSAAAYGFSANYPNLSVGSKLVTAVRKFDFDGGSYLEVQVRTTFAAGDTRFNYENIEMFRK